MMNSKLVLVLLLSSLAAVFIAQNIDVVEVSFLFWRASISSALLIFFTLLMGFFLGWATHVYFLFRRTRNELSFYRRT
jgi:putative membrane protein